MAHGRYKIVGKLADGGMAEIFLAKQHGAEGFEKRVVLKRVLSAFSADPQFRNMFLDEAHISMSLAHGNIVQVLDVGVAGARTFLVLELVEGWDLEHIMERAQATGPEHPWPPSLALYVTAQVCRGLAYAHAKCGPDGRSLGIVHRDVSPNNVLISEQGEVKLADFGIAKAETKRERTLAGVIKGKIGFMSPEQALGRPLDARADLFSVGTVMYLMLTGRRPFEAGSELESMLRAQRAEYRPPEELNPYLSLDATAIVNRAMRREPAARYQTADEMLIDVERVLRGQYRSAGQTELKLWLGELARRDGVLPIGRAQLLDDDGARPVFVDTGGDLSAGASVELSDFDGSAAATAVAIPTRARDATGTSGVPEAVPVGGSPRPTSSPPVVASEQTRAAPPDVSASLPAARPTPPATSLPGPSKARASVIQRLPRRSRVGLGFLLGALCMLGAVFGIRWLAAWAGREGKSNIGWLSQPTSSTLRPKSAPPSASTELSGSTSVPAETGREPPAANSAGHLDAGPARSQAMTSRSADAGVGDVAVAKAIEGASQGQKPILAASHDGEDDEDRLLGRVVPDAGTVVGEDEAEIKVAGKAKAKAKTESSSPSLSSHTPFAIRVQPVQIRITSSPLGAVVRTKNQVLGRTPLAIRFKPGNIYELTLVKSGYVTNTRRVAVSTGKPQSISVAMKKVPPPPPPHRGFFLRGR